MKLKLAAKGSAKARMISEVLRAPGESIKYLENKVKRKIQIHSRPMSRNYHRSFFPTGFFLGIKHGPLIEILKAFQKKIRGL